MAVAENVGAKIGTSGENLDETVVSSESNGTKPRTDSALKTGGGDGDDESMNSKYQQQPEEKEEKMTSDITTNNWKMENGSVEKSGDAFVNGSENLSGNGEDYKKYEMRDLVEMLSKLNPMAEEFVPPSVMANGYTDNNNNNSNGYNLNQGFYGGNGGFGYTNNFLRRSSSANSNGQTPRRKRNGFNQGRRRINTRTSHAQQEDVIKRTVYVSDIDQQVTEEQLMGLFLTCGQVVDCRICGDPNSVLRFAFVEFTDEEGARAALSLAGTMLGFYPVRVLPSKTAIAPVNPTFCQGLKMNVRCALELFIVQISTRRLLKQSSSFFEAVCGEVHRLRLLGDYQHSTRIAFVEFAVAESAIAALRCSGAILGSLPIRVSPQRLG